MSPTSKTAVSRRMTRVLAALSFRRLIRREDGTAAIEFALLAPAFLAQMFAILETGVVFFAGQTLETVAADSARLIMTGQAQTQGWNAAQFKSHVCSAITGLFSCQSGVYVDVETYSTLAAANLGMPVSGGTFNSSSLGYNPGGPGAIVVVRLYYKYPVYVDLFGFSLSTLTGGYNLLAATAVFKNEPYAAS